MTTAAILAVEKLRPANMYWSPTAAFGKKIILIP